MQTKKLYKYEGTIEGKTATLVSLMDIPYARPTEMVRLVADEGMALSNDGGVTFCACIDVATDEVSGWAEYEAPEEPEEPTEAEVG